LTFPSDFGIIYVENRKFRGVNAFHPVTRD
jgi:hypothetical protein